MKLRLHSRWGYWTMCLLIVNNNLFNKCIIYYDLTLLNGCYFLAYQSLCLMLSVLVMWTPHSDTTSSWVQGCPWEYNYIKQAHWKAQKAFVAIRHLQIYVKSFICNWILAGDKLFFTCWNSPVVAVHSYMYTTKNASLPTTIL